MGDGWNGERRVGRSSGHGRDASWLVASVATVLVVYAVYLHSHPYPGFGAGLYLQIATEIAATDYRLPTRIPGYTADGIPFAYPPLPLYVAAVLVDVGGVDPLTLSRYLPGLVVVLCVFPYYYAAKELLESTTAAGVATILVSVTPAVLRWHLSAGGIVRAPAFLFTVIGVYTGVKLFKRGDRRWLVPSTVAFALTVLSHPIYTVFFGTTYLLFVAAFDRSVRGVAIGAVVAIGGLLLAAPWWVHVVSIHGPDVFTGAAGTHSGIGGGITRVVSVFASPLSPDAETPFFIAAYAGAIYYLARRDYVLPLWMISVGYVVGKRRFMFVPGAMMASGLLVRWARSRTRTRETCSAWSERLRSLDPRLVVLLVVVVAGCLGALYAGGELNVWHDTSSQPAFVDRDDHDAMLWASGNTEEGAEFVVLGDAAEVFPLVADRPILVGHWGVEWEGAEAYRDQLALYRSVSTCETGACVTETLAVAEVRPDYIYVPRGHYTVQGEAFDAPEALAASLSDDPRYDVVFENDGVTVLRVTRAEE